MTYETANQKVKLAHEDGKQMEAFKQHIDGYYLVTQDFAKTLLEGTNRHNRRVKEKRVQGYRKLMNAGKWLLNREPLVFSKTSKGNKERCLSAQHRLLALSGAENAVLMEIAFTEDDNVDMVNSIDSGISRTAADQLQFLYEGNISSKNAVIFTSIAKLGMQSDEGKFPKKLHHESSVFINNWIEKNMEFLSKFVSHPSPLNENQTLLDEKNAYILSKAALTLSAYVINKKWGYDEAVSFVEKLVIGNNLDSESPILHAKDYLINVKTSFSPSWKKLTRVRSNTLCKTAVICKAFNRYKLEQSMKKMTLAEKDIEKEIFELVAPKTP